MMNVAPPDGLGERGRTLWDAITSEVEFRADERPILEDACRATDRIVEMRAAMESAAIVTKGSMGQTVVHPLIAEIRAHEAHVSQLLSKLKISDAAEPTGSVSARSTKAREAANAKWLTPHGKAS